MLKPKRRQEQKSARASSIDKLRESDAHDPESERKYDQNVTDPRYFRFLPKGYNLKVNGTAGPISLPSVCPVASLMATVPVPSVPV